MPLPPPTWLNSPNPVSYPDALHQMEAHVQKMLAGEATEAIWLLEHPAIYTAGTSANPSDLLNPQFPVFETGRGGQYTYHGPGQRVVYAMLDLTKRGKDVRAYIQFLERWVQATFATFGITAEPREGRVGLWVTTNGIEEKIAAIGVRVRRWHTFHGVAINVNPDLSHFQGIVPCGLSTYGVTSLAALGIDASMTDVDAALKQTFSTLSAS